MKTIGDILNILLLLLNALQFTICLNLREIELNVPVLEKLFNFFLFSLLLALSWVSQYGYNRLKILPNNTSKKYFKKYLAQKKLCKAFGFSGWLYIFLGLIILFFIKQNRFILFNYIKFASLLIVNGFFVIHYYRKLKF